MKWCGSIGFIEQVETRPGVYKDEPTVRKYRGDILQDTHRWESANQTNDNLNIDNRISIVSDLYANHKFGYMRWIEFMGEKWNIKSVQVQERRLIISIGDLYNTSEEDSYNGGD